MAHPDIELLNAVYPSVPAVDLPKSGGGFARFYDSPPVYTLLGSNEFTVNTTQTSNKSVGTIVVSDTDLYTKNAIIWVHIRDKAGARTGYFFGSDTFYLNSNAANNVTGNLQYENKTIIRYSTTSTFERYCGTTGYGVFPYSINSNGTVTIYARYNSSSSTTINGTFKVEIYKIELPSGVTLFN